MKIPRDIEAEVYFLTPEEGGRSTPVFNKYRSQFYYNGSDWVAQHEYSGVEKVNPGETVRVFLAFMSPQEHLGRIYIGMEFLIREGTRTVGRGKITKILELEVSTKRHIAKQMNDNTIEEFIDFLESIIFESFTTKKWEKYAINHYSNEAVENARRKLVKAVVNFDTKGEGKSLPLVTKEKLIKILEELKKNT